MTFELSHWLPAWLSIGGLAAVGYFLRDRIAKLIDARAQHYFDEQIERLKDDLSRSSKEIEALRASVLGLREQRQVNIERRKLQAIDQLWTAVKELRASKTGAALMATVDFEETAERAKSDQKFREMFEVIYSAFGKDLVPKHEAHEAQPYVSPLAWALFDAYQSAIGYLHAQLIAIKTGVGPEANSDPKDVISLISVALPNWKESLEKSGTTGFPNAIDELERHLLAELRRMIAGDENDAEQLAQAARISSQVEMNRRSEREATAKAALVAAGEEPQGATV